MDGPIVILSEVIEDVSYDIPYMWNLKRNDTNDLTSKIGRDRLREGTYGYHREAGGRWGKE